MITSLLTITIPYTDLCVLILLIVSSTSDYIEIIYILIPFLIDCYLNIYLIKLIKIDKLVTFL
jgi:hypothetical protein